MDRCTHNEAQLVIIVVVISVVTRNLVKEVHAKGKEATTELNIELRSHTQGLCQDTIVIGVEMMASSNTSLDFSSRGKSMVTFEPMEGSSWRQSIQI